MQFEDEKDYIMRIIKEMVAILSSLVLGKQYVQVELDKENKYGVSGAKPEKWKQLIDAGKINEAENMLLETLDYHDKDEVAAAVFFYEYIAEKGDAFLEKYNYSMEEALDGLKQIALHCGYKEVVEVLLQNHI